MAQTNLTLHVGTSGYSYKEWKGSFYPDDLPAAKMLDYYAQRFGAVGGNKRDAEEINVTRTISNNRSRHV